MNMPSHLKYVTIHPSKAEHDAECPHNPDRPNAVTWSGETPKAHFRVSRPERYASPGCPGHQNPSGRQGYYTDACCATQAARIIARRLAADVSVEPGTERLDVQVWR